MNGEFYWAAVYPELTLAGLVLLLLLLEAVCWPRRPRLSLGYLSLCGCLLALSLALVAWGQDADQQVLHGMVLLDAYAVFFDILLLAGTALVLLLSMLPLVDSGSHIEERFPLLLLSTLGMMVMACAGDLILLLAGMELMWLALTVLAGMEWRRPAANEASIKLFVAGAFASGLLFYGASLIYGEVGSTGLSALAEHLRSTDRAAWGLLLPGMGLLFAGLAVKVGLAPFHMWAPDALQGTAAPVAALLSCGSKAAGFAALGRILLCTTGVDEQAWMPLLQWLAGATAVGGYLLALNQRNLRRTLAYAGVAHSGYILLGFTAVSYTGLTAALFHLVGYGLAAIGSLALLVVCRCGEEGNAELEDYRGLAFRHPWLGAAMTLFMLSLAGLPPTAGFMGRLYLLNALVEAGQIHLALGALLGALLGAYVHLKVVVQLFMADPGDGMSTVAAPPEGLAVLLLTALGTLGLGLWPGPLIDAVRSAVIAVM